MDAVWRLNMQTHNRVFETAYRAAVILRHTPPRQVGRRLWLQTKRRVLARLPLPTSGVAPNASFETCDFMPIFAGNSDGINTGPGGYTFTFLNRSQAMGRRIDWGAPADQLWRMNLHYMSYLGGVTDAVFIDLVSQWIEANRPYGPGYWNDAWNAYALSIRVTNWLDEFARRRDRLPLAFAVRLTDSLVEQLDFLERNLETDIRGNHLIKNIRALAMAARLLSAPSNARWSASSRELLADVLDEQVLADGVHYERSPSYHAQVFGDLIAVRYALWGRAQNTDPLAARLDRALAAMAQAAVDLSHPDGYVALFNDSGLHMAPAPEVLLAAYADLFGSRPDARSRFAFPNAGYFGLRDENVYLIADCGRLGPDALMAHAHGDALSFELSVLGERIVVDQGVYEYVPGLRRGASRAAHFHNTLSIAGLDQADCFGAFRCGARPDVRLIEYGDIPSGFRLEGSHDGFCRTGNGPVHRRRFRFDAGKLAVDDWLEGAGAPGDVTTGILLHPACRVVEEDGGVVVTGERARLRITASVPVRLEPAVYWSDMGSEEATTRLRFVWPTEARAATTEIDLGQTSQGESPE